MRKMSVKDKDEVTRLNPIVRVILQGLYDVESPLHLLLGLPPVIKAIWLDVVAYWKSKIKEPEFRESNLSFVKVKWGHFYTPEDSDADWLVQFPKPKKININMMPFVMARRFKETKLPKYLRSYWEQMVDQCIVVSERGKIGYLTIQESFVGEGSSQRRPGIHTESPGVVFIKGSRGQISHHRRLFSWGHGVSRNELKLEGGIYMASNVENSCKVWNCQILQPTDNSPDVVGDHGDVEHLREFLPSGEIMAANTVYWLTDRTPHESLPLTKGTYRQFFRLVTSEVSIWHEDHSTKNPLGVVPDPKVTKIVKGSKFDGTCYEVEPVPE